jgi:hypothetical protein
LLYATDSETGARERQQRVVKVARRLMGRDGRAVLDFVIVVRLRQRDALLVATPRENSFADRYMTKGLKVQSGCHPRLRNTLWVATDQV